MLTYWSCTLRFLATFCLVLAALAAFRRNWQYEAILDKSPRNAENSRPFGMKTQNSCTKFEVLKFCSEGFESALAGDLVWAFKRRCIRIHRA